jgi:hypothetical protein
MRLGDSTKLVRLLPFSLLSYTGREASTDPVPLSLQTHSREQRYLVGKHDTIRSTHKTAIDLDSFSATGTHIMTMGTIQLVGS